MSDLDALVEECLAYIEDEGETALERMCRRHPEHAERLRERIRLLRESGFLSAAEPAAGDAFPERLGDFRLLRRLGGGGMGVVYLATQESIGREVALKVIRRDQLFFPGARRRFRREVEAVGRMQHPAIVPVYAVGEEQGVPYLAMERIEGVSLQDVLAELRGTEPADVKGPAIAALVNRLAGGSEPAAGWPHATSWRDWCIHVVLQVALALEHAHGRGVLHRDVKPSNVLVGRDGRVFLVDFGLAANAGDHRLTRTGAALGSLPYMSPEQIRGEAADPRTDVWGLGATLHELLAFRTPFMADSAELLTRRILEDEVPSLRRWNPALGSDDDTVCRKALEKQPERRYGSARAFAADLENLLARRPVEARPASFALRGLRLVQRHPGAATAVLLAFLLVVVAPSVLAILQLQAGRRIQRANDQLALALARAETERTRAEANLARAREAVDLILHEAAARLLEGVPRMAAARRVLLERAVGFYESLLAQEPLNPAMQFEMAQIQRSLGDIYYAFARPAEARAAYDRQIETLRRLRNEHPGWDEVGYQLASALSMRAKTDSGTGRFAAALAQIAESKQLLADFTAAHPDDASAWHQRALVELEDAQTRWQTGDAELAMQGCTVALASAERALAIEPEASGGLEARGGALLLRSTLYYARRDYDAAVTDLQGALDALRPLLERPDVTMNPPQLFVATATNLGATLVGLGRYEEARQTLHEAIAAAERFRVDYPENESFPGQLANAYINLGMVQSGSEDPEGPDASWQRAATILRERVAVRDDDYEVHHALGLTLGNLAARTREGGDLQAADALIREGLAALSRAAELAPDHPLVRRHLASIHFNLAVNELELDRPAACAEALAAVDPGSVADPTTARTLAELWLQLAEATPDDLLRTRARADALVALCRAVELGYDDREDLEQSTRLAPLRDHPDYPRLPPR